MVLSKPMKERVCVGLSGGVDSSVAAKRLIERGYEVIGVFIKTWHPDFIECNMEAERLDAMRVAAHLNIPFLTCDAEQVYKNDVADYMIREYAAGRTPNPDIMCNRAVKFGAFYNFAKDIGASYIATGHYARIQKKESKTQLLRGVDTDKDQSYFLWTLTERELNHILFPVGGTQKREIREEATRAKLPTATKSDSQGICFLGKVDMESFLGHYIKTEPGIVQSVHGEKIGHHTGALYFTLGQRHGFTIDHSAYIGKPLYVVQKDMEQNCITVDFTPKHLNASTVLTLTQVNNLSNESELDISVQFRYRQKPIPATLLAAKGTNRATVRINADTVEEPSMGQSCVFYKEDVCLGGGIIDTAG